MSACVRDGRGRLWTRTGDVWKHGSLTLTLTGQQFAELLGPVTPVPTAGVEVILGGEFLSAVPALGGTVDLVSRRLGDLYHQWPRDKAVKLVEAYRELGRAARLVEGNNA